MNPHSGTDRIWRVFYTHPRAEKKCEERLRQQEIDVFLPRVVSLRQWKDRKKEIEAPLFPNYIFARVCERERLIALQTQGIVRCISLGGQIARVSAEEIEQLMIMQKDPKRLMLADAGMPPIGKKVTIFQGPMEGLQGEVIEHRRHVFVIVRIETIRQAVKVNIPASWVRSVEAPVLP